MEHILFELRDGVQELQAFLSFFLNKYNISDAVLWYIAEALIYAGVVFGVSVYLLKRKS